MMRWFWAVLLLIWAAPAAACPEPGPDILIHTCWGDLRVRVLLLAAEAERLDAPPGSVTVTGGYTGTEERESGGPLPVGLFVHRGAVVNPNMGRMDGILVVRPDGSASIFHRERVRAGGRSMDLTALPARRAFAAMAKAEGWSVLQSHLLVVAGKLDVRPRDGAPTTLRRILIQDAAGLGIVQTPRAMTLFEAGDWAMRTYRPLMAMNLDMGTYDYCRRLGPDVGDVAENCGRVGQSGLAILSNLIRVAPKLLD